MGDLKEIGSVHLSNLIFHYSLTLDKLIYCFFYRPETVLSLLRSSLSTQNALLPTLSHLVKLLLTFDIQLRYHFIYKDFSELLPSEPYPTWFKLFELLQCYIPLLWHLYSSSDFRGCRANCVVILFSLIDRKLSEASPFLFIFICPSTNSLSALNIKFHLIHQLKICHLPQWFQPPLTQIRMFYF